MKKETIKLCNQVAKDIQQVGVLIEAGAKDEISKEEFDDTISILIHHVHTLMLAKHTEYPETGPKKRQRYGQNYG